MSDRSVIPLSALSKMGKLDETEYFRRYKESLQDPNGFWGREGKRLLRQAVGSVTKAMRNRWPGMPWRGSCANG